MAVEHSRSIRAMAPDLEEMPPRRAACRYPRRHKAGHRVVSGSARRLGPPRISFNLNTPPAFPHGMPCSGACFGAGFEPATHRSQSVALPMSYPIAVCCSTDELSKGDGIEPPLLAWKASAHHGRDPVMEHGAGRADRARGVSEPQRNDKTGRAYRPRKFGCRAAHARCRLTIEDPSDTLAAQGGIRWRTDSRVCSRYWAQAAPR